MNPDQDSLLRDLALHLRGAIPILEAARIDYYCAATNPSPTVARRPTSTPTQSCSSSPPRGVDHGPRARLAVSLSWSSFSHIDERYHRAHLAALSELRGRISRQQTASSPIYS